MTIKDLIYNRLINQLISSSGSENPEQVVSSLGAIQAQDYYGSLWAIGLRLKNSTEEGVEKAITERKIVRTWPMRGTLHFVAAEDIRWMLTLFAQRIISGTKSRHKQLELDEKIFNRSKEVFIKNLQGGKQLTRDDMYKLLEKNKISSAGQRGIHILRELALDGLLCFGNRHGKQQTFVLLDEWVPNSKNLNREESLAEITLRYFNSHGPATLYDFSWWSGLTIADAKSGLEMVKHKFIRGNYNDRTFISPMQRKPEKKSLFNSILLPAFDEYLVGYKTRSDVLKPEYKKFANAGGMLSPTIINHGKVSGTWRRSIKSEKVIVELFPFAALSKTYYKNVLNAAELYGRFINKKIFIKLRK
jgi:hypothetical protein